MTNYVVDLLQFGSETRMWTWTPKLNAKVRFLVQQMPIPNAEFDSAFGKVVDFVKFLPY